MLASTVKDLCVPENATLREALLCFERTGLPVVLICDSQYRLVGLATEGDVRRGLLAGHGLVSPLVSLANCSPVVGTTAMSRDALVSLLSDRVHSLPVLDKQGVVQDILLSDRRSSIPVATPSIGERELRYVSEAVLSGWVSSQGKYIGMFEEKLAAFCQTPYAIAVSNGTTALHIALSALGIGPGDEVIVPALTFVASASAVKHCYATPVFVDVERTSWNLDCDQLEAAITPRTRAIMPVHLYGQPCRIDRIMEIAARHKLWVVEDAAEALGAEFMDRKMGSFGHLGCFSFFGNKIITTGEGGAVVTSDPALNARIRLLRDHGMSPGRRYWHEVVGFNYRMTNLQAAIGVAQLERWEQIYAAKERVRLWYAEHVQSDRVFTASGWPQARPVCWLYTLQLRRENTRIDRDTLLDCLRVGGVDCRPVFSPLPAMPPYFEADWATRYPVTREISEQGFSLPSSVELHEKDLQRIVEDLERLLAQ